MKKSIVRQKIGNTTVVIVPPKITDVERMKRIRDIKKTIIHLLWSKEVRQCKRSLNE